MTDEAAERDVAWLLERLEAVERESEGMRTRVQSLCSRSPLCLP